MKQHTASRAAEAAVGMTGFAGIVAAIRSRDISSWAHEQRILLSMLLIASAMAISFALLPAVLTEAQLPEPAIWRIGSISLMVWQAAIALHRSRQFRAGGTASPLPWLPYAWVTVILALQALNVVVGASWPYLVGVFGILVNAFPFFLILLRGRTDEEDDAT